MNNKNSFLLKPKFILILGLAVILAGSYAIYRQEFYMHSLDPMLSWPVDQLNTASWKPKSGEKRALDQDEKAELLELLNQAKPRYPIAINTPIVGEVELDWGERGHYLLMIHSSEKTKKVRGQPDFQPYSATLWKFFGGVRKGVSTVWISDSLGILNAM